MTITRSRIAATLHAADVEGLLALEAPRDEYDREAQVIFSAIQALPDGHKNEAEVGAILALTWADAFDLAATDMQQRMSALQQIAKQIVAAAA